MAVTPLTFKVLRLLSDGEFRSGEDIARCLDVSRATVCGSLQTVETLGVEVYKVRGRGYRLPTPIEWLDADLVQAGLTGRAAALSVQVTDLADSTNSQLMRGAQAGASHGSCLAAEVQTGGRGRRGRAWHADLGGSLLFSVLWRFAQGVGGLSGLSLAVGVALLRGLHRYGISGAKLKWPNDVLHQYRKLAGILVEVQGEMMGPSAAVIGVGLNVRLGTRARSAIDQAAADLQSLHQAPVRRNELLVCLLESLADVLTEFEQGGFAALREEWSSYHAYEGRTVRLILPGGRLAEGVVSGVAADGALLLSTDEGLQRFSTGEVSLRSA